MYPRESRDVKLLILGDDKNIVDSILSSYLLGNQFNKGQPCLYSDLDASYPQRLKLDGKLITLDIWFDKNLNKITSSPSPAKYFATIAAQRMNVKGIVFAYDITNKKSLDIIDKLRLAAIDYEFFALVGTTSRVNQDPETHRKVDDKEAQDYAQKHNMLFCDITKENHNIKELFHNLVRKIRKSSEEKEIKIDTSKITDISSYLILDIVEKRLCTKTLQELAQKKLFKEKVLSYLTKLRLTDLEKKPSQLKLFHHILDLNNETNGLEEFFSIKRPKSLLERNLFTKKKNTLEQFKELQITSESEAKKELSEITKRYLASLRFSQTIADQIEKIRALNLPEEKNKFFEKFKDPYTGEYIQIPVALVSSGKITYFDLNTLLGKDKNPLTGEVFSQQQIQPGSTLLMEFDDIISVNFSCIDFISPKKGEKGKIESKSEPSFLQGLQKTPQSKPVIPGLKLKVVDSIQPSSLRPRARG